MVFILSNSISEATPSAKAFRIPSGSSACSIFCFRLPRLLPRRFFGWILGCASAEGLQRLRLEMPVTGSVRITFFIRALLQACLLAARISAHGGCPIFLHLELGACAVLAGSLRAHSLAHNGFRAGSSHYKTNTMSVFEPLRQPCAVLARSLREQGFCRIMLDLVFAHLKL